MNILFLTGNLEIGGTEFYALDYAKAMNNNSHRAYWGTISDGPMKEKALSENVELLHCMYGRRLPIEFVLSTKKIQRAVSQFDINIVHAIDAFSALEMTWAFRNKKKKPKLVWSSVGVGTKSYGLIKKLCEPSLDRMIAPSNFIRNRMIEEGFDPEKITVYSQSREMRDSTEDRKILRSKLKLDQNDFVLGSVGRLSKMKGNLTLVKAMPDALAACPNLKLVIVGDGPERAALQNAAQAYGIADKVIFTGFRTDIENVYSIFDAVAFPTYYEALGYIPYEAMYYEKPLIASLTGGIPEIVIDHYNGILVPPAVTDKWTNAIVSVASDQKLYEQLRVNGKRYYNQYLAFDPKHKELERFYASLL